MRRSIIVFIILISCLLFNSCIGPGLSDWHYEFLPNYTIFRSSSVSRELAFTKEEYNIEYLVRGNICEIKYSTDYIAVKEGGFSEKGVPIPKRYYLVYTKDNSVIEYNSMEDLENRIKELEINDMTKWMNLYNNPWE
jgi:hypothetical protein